MNMPIDLVETMVKSEGGTVDLDAGKITFKRSGSKRRKKVPQSVADKIKKKLSVDPKRPSYDMVVTCVGYDADFNKVEKRDVIKWQPPSKDAEAWDKLEMNLVNADVKQSSDAFQPIFPPAPYSWAYDFFRHFDIDDYTSKLVSRVEIVVAKDLLSFVVVDNTNFKDWAQVFWHYMSQMYSGDGTRVLLHETKIDFEELSAKLKKDPYICERQKFLQHAGERIIGGSFATPYLASAFDKELPIVEKLEIDEAEREDEKRANLDF